MNPETETPESKEQFKTDAAGLQRRWLLELQAAKENLEEFHNEGDVTIKEFLGKNGGESSLNLFHADVTTKSANLSGVPKVRARRRFADANDDVARVSAEMLERHLDTDIERESDGFRKALANAKSDWLKPGLGQVRLRYVPKFEDVAEVPAQTDEAGTEIAPAVAAHQRKVSEDVETDYVKWRRFLWTPAETWDDVRAVFFGLDLSKEAFEEAFPGRQFQARSDRKEKQPDAVKDTFARAEVWEIWDKESRRVLFLAEGQAEILKVQDDVLGLPGFFPCPEPLAANVTTSKYVPRANYYLAKPQYEEAKELTRRIRKLVRFVRVSGAYDKTNAGLENLLADAYDGKLVPVGNWSALVTKGGMQGAIAFLPIKEPVEAIISLSQRLDMVKREIYEITGQSDIMRGQAAEKATATEQRIKARFGSSRIQAEQDEFARFASDAQRIRAFIIAKNFDAETIVQRSNIDQAETIEVPSPPPAPGAPPGPPQKVPNTKLIQAAVEMLKSDISAYRIDVDSDSLSMTDFDAVQQDAITLMQGTAQFFQGMLPVAQAGGQPMLKLTLEMYQALISTFRGSQRFEGIVDRAIADFEQAAAAPKAPPPPDPKLEAAKVKAQAEMGKAQASILQTKVDTQAHLQTTAMDAQAKQAEFGMRMAELRAKQEAAADVAPPGGEA